MLVSKCRIHEIETIKFWCTDCEVGICHSCIPLYHDTHVLKTYRKHLHEQLTNCIDKEEKRLNLIQALSDEVIRECGAKLRFHEKEVETYRQRDQLLHNNQSRHLYLLDTCKVVRKFAEDFHFNIDLGLVESFLERHSYILEKVATDTLHSLQTTGSFHFVTTFQKHKYLLSYKTAWTGGTQFCYHDNHFQIDLESKSGSKQHTVYITWEYKGKDTENLENFFFSGELLLHSDQLGEEIIPFAAFNAMKKQKTLTCELLIPPWETTKRDFLSMPKKLMVERHILEIKWSLRFGFGE